MGKESNKLLVLIVVGVFLGLIGGYFLGQWQAPQDAELRSQVLKFVSFPGELFLRMLRLLVIPLIAASMIVGVCSLGDVRHLGKIGLRTLAYYLFTTGLAVLLGIVLVCLIQPGIGVAPSAQPSGIAPKEAVDNILDMVRMMVPENLFGATIESNILGIIVFALVFGAVLTTIGEKGKLILQFFDALNDVLMKIVHLIMWFAPIGIMCLVAGKLGEEGDAFVDSLQALGGYMATILIGLAVHGFITLPLIYWIFVRKNPFRYMLHMIKPIVTAWSTASSSATLPVTMESVRQAGVSEKSSSFVLPLGATINMDGTALYEAVAVIFISQTLGLDLSTGQIIVLFLTATLASIGAAGIPQAGLVTMVMVLTAVGLPVEGIGTILAVDWFLDRFRTATNVWGDGIGAAVIDQYEKKIS